MNDTLVYARSPALGEIEIVVSKNHTAEAYKLSEAEIAALWGALSEAIRHNYVDSLSPTRKTSANGLEAIRQASGYTSRPLRNDNREGMIHTPWGLMPDKSKRKYGVRK